MRHSGSRLLGGGPRDNAAMEFFFSLLQKNVLNRQPWTLVELFDVCAPTVATWVRSSATPAGHRMDRHRATRRLRALAIPTESGPSAMCKDKLTYGDDVHLPLCLVPS